MERPELNEALSVETFLKHYYLKTELLAFCRCHKLALSGGKEELSKRIAYFLETGKQLSKQIVKSRKHSLKVDHIEKTMQIETDFVCTQVHRAFFEKHIGPGFSFTVAFQKWLKTHAGSTYQEAIEAYAQCKQAKTKTKIDPQFEYNTYIRDFFADNKGKTLQDAIACWNYKKSLPGTHRYEQGDLLALKKSDQQI